MERGSEAEPLVWWGAKRSLLEADSFLCTLYGSKTCSAPTRC